MTKAKGYSLVHVCIIQISKIILAKSKADEHIMTYPYSSIYPGMRENM